MAKKKSTTRSKKEPRPTTRAAPVETPASKHALIRLDLTFLIPATAPNRQRLKRMAKALEHSREGSIVEGSVLPADESERIYLYFHVDPGDSPQDAFFAHLRYVVQPRSPAPSFLSKRREDGTTMEWTQEQLRSTTGSTTDAEQRFLVKSRLRTSEHMKNRVVALIPPKRIDGKVFEWTGAELTVRGEGAKGLRGFAWHEDQGGTDIVDLTYLVHDIDWTNPWKGEERRCPGYLEKIT